MKRISFDLETLGNKNYAPIIQIGAVKFNVKGQTEEPFKRTIDLERLREYPELKMDYSTIQWWLNQTDDARKSIAGYDIETMSLRQALYEFIKWIGPTSQFEYWSHATFDPPILMNNLNVVGLGQPIPYRKFRDIRTINSLTGNMDVGERKGTHHDALDDAIFQAKYISASLRKINKWRKNGNN